MVGTGFALGGAAENRTRRERIELEDRRVSLGEREAVLDRQQKAQALIRAGLDTTQTEINGLIDAAREAKAKGASPDRLKAIRRLIELKGGDLNIAMPGIPQPAGATPVPGSEAVIQSGLNRFDALVGATQQASAPQFEGKGFQAQASNILIELSGKIQKGAPLSGEEKRAYSIAFAEATKPRVVGSPSTGFSLIAPTIDENLFPRPETIGAPTADTAPAAPSPALRSGAAGVTPLSGPTRQKANEAGRSELVTQGAKSARSVSDAVVNPDGSINRDTVFSMVTDVPLLGKGLPGTEGRTIRGQVEDALAAKLRLETGATANETELQNIVDRFLPSLFDSDATVRDKMSRLTSFFEGTLKRTDPELFESLTGRARESGDIPEPPEDEPNATFEGFDPSSGVAVFKRPDGTFFGVPRAGN